MESITKHKVYLLDQEIDAVETYPTNPKYVVIGTYSLVNQSQQDLVDTSSDEAPSSQSSSLRIGSLQILAIDEDIVTDISGESSCDILCRWDLPCAVLDVHFCPTDPTLLGVATSIGDIRFFRITGLEGAASTDGNISAKIRFIGIAEIYDDCNSEEKAQIPLITQFAWFEEPCKIGPVATFNGHTIHTLTVCDTTGKVNIIRVEMPTERQPSGSDHKFDGKKYLQCKTEAVHKHLYNLEAWTTSIIQLPGVDSNVRHVILSGGDDSCFIASMYTTTGYFAMTGCDPNVDTVESALALDGASSRIHLDKQTHTAGVVSIAPIPAYNTIKVTIDIKPDIQGETKPSWQPILTGSYDQCLRLILFNPSSNKFSFASDLGLEGGVWRIKLLDMYLYSSPEVDNTSQKQVHYILLISAMHAGCYIVRLITTPIVDDDGDAAAQEPKWTWKVEARFTKPHESMVYACTAVATSRDIETGSRWRVVSTSFYDKRICLWDWTDRLR